MFFDKMNEFLKNFKQVLPEAAFLFFSTRLIILGASVGDALALVSIVGIIGFQKYLAKNQVSQAEELKKEISEIKNQIHSLKMDKMVRRSPNESQVQNQSARYF